MGLLLGLSILQAPEILWNVFGSIRKMCGEYGAATESRQVITNTFPNGNVVELSTSTQIIGLEKRMGIILVKEEMVRLNARLDRLEELLDTKK